MSRLKKKIVICGAMEVYGAETHKCMDCGDIIYASPHWGKECNFICMDCGRTRAKGEQIEITDEVVKQSNELLGLDFTKEDYAEWAKDIFEEVKGVAS